MNDEMRERIIDAADYNPELHWHSLRMFVAGCIVTPVIWLLIGLFFLACWFWEFGALLWFAVFVFNFNVGWIGTISWRKTCEEYDRVRFWESVREKERTSQIIAGK